MNGVPLFLDQIVEILRLSSDGSGEIGKSANLHGGDLLQRGFTVGQVVYDYGDICQVITELAMEQNAPISNDEFHTFNRCLDDAIAHAVTEYERQREQRSSDQGTERLASLAHELRNLLSSASLAFHILKQGHVAIGGSTGAVLERSLSGLHNLINRSLAEVRIEAGIDVRDRIGMAELVEEVEIAAALDAKDRGIDLSVGLVGPQVAVAGDRQVLAAAVSNLLQNAFKFTRPQGHVALNTRATAERVLIDIEDECGGLPPGKAEALFEPFQQRGANRTGLGLGLTITRRGIQAMGGEVQVRNLPGRGCVFTIDLPRLMPPPDGGTP